MFKDNHNLIQGCLINITFIFFSLLLNVDIGKMPHSEASDVGLLQFLKVPSALHALSNARPPCMRMVAGSILGSGNIISLRLFMTLFIRPFSPYR